MGHERDAEGCVPEAPILVEHALTQLVVGLGPHVRVSMAEPRDPVLQAHPSSMHRSRWRDAPQRVPGRARLARAETAASTDG